MPSVEVWIGLGANLGDRRRTLERAVAILGASPGIEVVEVSPWVETEPVGGPADQPSFINGVLLARSELGPRELLARLLEIEALLGRERPRGVANAPRTIDLDLLLYGDEEHLEADLIVPHPRMEERLFVLEPMARLRPDLKLRGCGRTVRERVQELGQDR